MAGMLGLRVTVTAALVASLVVVLLVFVTPPNGPEGLFVADTPGADGGAERLRRAIDEGRDGARAWPIRLEYEIVAAAEGADSEVYRFEFSGASWSDWTNRMIEPPSLGDAPAGAIVRMTCLVNEDGKMTRYEGECGGTVISTRALPAAAAGPNSLLRSLGGVPADVVARRAVDADTDATALASDLGVPAAEVAVVAWQEMRRCDEMGAACDGERTWSRRTVIHAPTQVPLQVRETFDGVPLLDLDVYSIAYRPADSP